MYAETYILLCNNISKERSRHLIWLGPLALCLLRLGEMIGKLRFFLSFCLSIFHHLTVLTHSCRKIPRISCEHGKSTNSMKTSRIIHVFFSSLYYHYVARCKSNVGFFHISKENKKQHFFSGFFFFYFLGLLQATALPHSASRIVYICYDRIHLLLE